MRIENNCIIKTYLDEAQNLADAGLPEDEIFDFFVRTTDLDDGEIAEILDDVKGL